VPSTLPLSGDSPAPLALAVALVARSPLVLAGLRSGLASAYGLDIVAQAVSLTALRSMLCAPIDVVLSVVDTGWSLESPVASEAIDTSAPVPSVPVPHAQVFLLSETSHNDDWEALLTSGHSVLSESADFEQIAAAVRAAAAGLCCLSSSLLIPGRFSTRESALLQTQPSRDEPRNVAKGEFIESLTAREHQVLIQMTEGLANREIAVALEISTHTAKFHVAQVIAKLHATSRAHAVAKAMRAGLIAA
jgi:DNA-binding NarL/FixJ family response regulator